ncbi:MAG: hypothetical protein LUD50_05515 [Clostridia bacterium]|nr:hypothetical protein [Clostridia bacterium]
MAKRKRQLIEDTRSNTCLYYILNISESGVFSKIPLDHVGFDPYILDLLTSHRIKTIGQLIVQSPASLRKKRYLQGLVIDMLDALDEYFCRAFEKGRKAYNENPLPIYKLLGLEDIGRYRNFLLYDFKSRLSFEQTYADLCAHGIITLQDLLKMNLVSWHEICALNADVYVRRMLRDLSAGLDSRVRNIIPMAYPLDDAGTEIITYPLPPKAIYAVSSLTDDRIAGDEVSTEGLTPYEKALYDKTCEAIEDCGEGFYYDVMDNREFFECLAKSLSVFWPPALQLMQRRTMLHNLYMSVPERFRKIPARALYHYRAPRRKDGFKCSPYETYNYCHDREVWCFASWEIFQGKGRMMPLEDCYRHLEKQAWNCETIDDFDRLIEADRDWQFLDLLYWLGRVSMLTAIYDNFLRCDETAPREASDGMKALVRSSDPDEVIAWFTATNHTKQLDTRVFEYYDRPYVFYWFNFRSRYTTCRYDFFAVYMLLTGKTSVPFSLARGLLHPEDAISLRNFFYEYSDSIYLYNYNPKTDTVTIKPHALEL